MKPADGETYREILAADVRLTVAQARDVLDEVQRLRALLRAHCRHRRSTTRGVLARCDDCGVFLRPGYVVAVAAPPVGEDDRGEP
jgi:hypothetical protein